MQSDLLRGAEAGDEGVELGIGEGDSKCRRILSNVSFAGRSSFRKCGFGGHVGPVHEGIHVLWVAGSGGRRWVFEFFGDLHGGCGF